MSDDTESETAEEVAADEADDEAAEEETTETEQTGFQQGDFVKLDYTARTVDDGQLVDTTDPEVAEEAGVGEDQEFAPRTVVLGQGHIFRAVEDDIVGKEAGDTGTVTVPATEAFGEYEEEEVRTVSADKIDEDDRYPGEDVEYEYEILEEVTDREEQAQGIIEMMLDMQLELWFETETVEEEQVVQPDEEDLGEGEEPEPVTETVEEEQETLYIEATPQLTMNQQWMMGKQQIAQQLTQLLDVDRIIVQEEIGGGGMGMPGMMGGMGGGDVDIEEAVEEMDLDDEDIDAEEIVEEIEDN